MIHFMHLCGIWFLQKSTLRGQEVPCRDNQETFVCFRLLYKPPIYLLLPSSKQAFVVDEQVVLAAAHNVEGRAADQVVDAVKIPRRSRQG